MKKDKNKPEESVLTTIMDVGTKGFDEFQTIVLNKSRQRTENQKRNIELLSFKYQMEDYIKLDTKDVRPVGDFLKSILKLLHIQQNTFADYIGLKPSNLSKLLNGERSINYDLALIFGRIFNHDPMLWIEIQAKNEINRLEHSDKKKYFDYSLKDLIGQQKKAG
ncbi:MAG: helix-turn-helix transcriptional regulator [Cyclobacteriaceae bacterium]